MLKKILGLNKKSSDFYLVLDEEQLNQETNSNTVLVTPPDPEAKTDTDSSTVPNTEPKKKSQTAQKKSQELSVVNESEPEVETTANTIQEASTESEPAVSAAKSPKTVTNVEELIANAVGLTYGGTPAVKTTPDVSETDAKSVTIKTFATDYLLSKPAPNRRPGASLNKFREMTRTMKVKMRSGY